MCMRMALITMLLTGTWFVGAQINPFELRHRLDPEERQLLIFSQRNPFELIRGAEARAIAAFLPGAVQPAGAVQPLADQRYLEVPDLLFWVYLIMLIYATLLINLGRTPIGRWGRALFNGQLTTSLLRERERGGIAPYLMWFVFYGMSMGIFLYQALNHWSVGAFPGDQPLFMVWIGLGVSGFYAVKHLVLALMAMIFPLSRSTRPYSFTVNLFNLVLGMALYPLSIGLSYGSGGLREVFLYLGVSIIALSYLIRIIRGLLIGFPHLVESPIHFFLYLCSVEAAPVLVLFKWIQQGGLQGS